MRLEMYYDLLQRANVLQARILRADVLRCTCCLQLDKIDELFEDANLPGFLDNLTKAFESGVLQANSLSAGMLWTIAHNFSQQCTTRWRSAPAVTDWCSVMLLRFGPSQNLWMRGEINANSSVEDRLKVATAQINLPICSHQYLRENNRKRDVDPTWYTGMSHPRMVFFAAQHRKLAPEGPVPIHALMKVDGSDTGRAELDESKRGGTAEDMPTEHLQFTGDHDTGGILDDADCEENFNLFCSLRRPLSDSIAASLSDREKLLEPVKAAADFLQAEAEGPLLALKDTQQKAHQDKQAEFDRAAERTMAPAQQRNELSRLQHLADQTAHAIARVQTLLDLVHQFQSEQADFAPLPSEEEADDNIPPEDTAASATLRLLQRMVDELHAIFKLRRLPADTLFLVLLESTDHLLCIEIAVLWLGRKLTGPEMIQVYSKIASDVSIVTEGQVEVIGICYDGEHHRHFTADQAGQPPCTLGIIRERAVKSFEHDKAAITEQAARGPAIEKTQRTRLAIAAKYTEQAPEEPLPQHPDIPGYQPDHQRLLTISKEQRDRFQKAVSISVDGGATQWVGLDNVAPALTPHPSSFQHPDPCSAAGLKQSLLPDINNIASPLYLSDLGLLSRLLIYPDQAKHPRGLDLPPSQWAEADRIRWLVHALASKTAIVHGLSSQTITAILWRELQQAYMDMQRMQSVMNGLGFKSRYMCPLRLPRSGAPKLLFEDFHHKLKNFIQLIMRQKLLEACPEPAETINDGKMPILMKTVLHDAANHVYDQQQETLAKDLPPITGQHALQVINGKADDQNVPCALAFFSCPQLSAELVSMGYSEQATFLRSLAREELAWDARGLTREMRDMLLHERKVCCWRVLGNAPFLVSKLPANSRGMPTQLTIAVLTNIECREEYMMVASAAHLFHWVDRVTGTDAVENRFGLLAQVCCRSPP